MTPIKPLRFLINPKKKEVSALVRFPMRLYAFLVAACLLLNFYFLFMPIRTKLAHDEVEHLHVSYLMSLGDRPFVDFIENHPMLFNHYLGWIKNLFHMETTRAWAQAARWTLFLHFLLFLSVAGSWISKLTARNRPAGIKWMPLFVTALVMVDFSGWGFAMIWQIRPDFICHAYTLLGCYIAYLSFRSISGSIPKRNIAGVIIGGCAVGIGNAVLPKGGIILISILLTIITAELLSPSIFVPDSFSRRNIIRFILLFIASAFAAFCIGMLIDCHLSNISPAKWVSAVILINAKKHVVLSATEDNPVTWMLTAFSAGNIFVAFLILLLIVVELARLKSRILENRGECLLILSACYMIFINMFIPPYSNGATWSHHFIPAIFSTPVFFLILTTRVARITLYSPPKPLSIAVRIGVGAFVAFLSVQLMEVPLHLYDKFRSRAVSARGLRSIPRDDFIIDAYCPKDFTYFAGFPGISLPVQSRHWGFYYMLGSDRKFWEHCYKLGIGPNPATIYKNGFGNDPPDAVIFGSPEDVIKYVVVVRQTNDIDASRIVNDIRIRYTPMKIGLFWMYIRNDHVDVMSNRGWRPAPEYALSFKYDDIDAALQPKGT